MRWVVVGVAVWLLLAVIGLMIWYLTVRISELERDVVRLGIHLENHVEGGTDGPSEDRRRDPGLPDGPR